MGSGTRDPEPTVKSASAFPPLDADATKKCAREREADESSPAAGESDGGQSGDRAVDAREQRRSRTRPFEALDARAEYEYCRSRCSGRVDE